MAKKNAPLRGLYGIDANTKRVINVARPDDAPDSTRQDAINLEYFIEKNTTQEFDITRTYPANFIISFEDTLYISKWDILDVASGLGVKPTDRINQPVDETDSNPWSVIRTDRSIQVVDQTTTYYTELSRFYLVNSTNDTSVLRLPDILSRNMTTGQRVTVIDSGNARNNPITVLPDGTAAIDGAAEYKIFTNKDEVHFVWTGSNWTVDRRRGLIDIHIKSSDTSDSNYHELFVNENLSVATDSDFYVELPAHAMIGDIIEVNALTNELLDDNDIIVKVNATTTHKIDIGKLSLKTENLDTFKFSAKSHIVFKYVNNNLWEIFTKDADSVQLITDTSILKHYKNVVVDTTGKTGEITLTLPEDLTHGQQIKISNIYQNADCDITLKSVANVIDNRHNKFKGDLDNTFFKNHIDYGTTATITMDGLNGRYIELVYIVEADGNACFYVQNMSSGLATETQTGLSRLSTTDEIDAGTEDGAVVITPAKLKHWLNKDEHFATAAPNGLVAVDGLKINNNIWEGIDLTMAIATEDQRGTLEVATQEEVDAGTDDITIVTPKKLNGLRATETQAGIARIANNAEVDAGTSNDTIITPNRLKRWMLMSPDSQATTETSGFVQLGKLPEVWHGTSFTSPSEAESESGTHDKNIYTPGYVDYDATRVITPQSLNYALENYLPRHAIADDSWQLGGKTSTWYNDTLDWHQEQIDRSVVDGGEAASVDFSDFIKIGNMTITATGDGVVQFTFD